MERKWENIHYMIKILVYSQVTQKEIQFSFSIEQEALVSNIKAASVQLYDYYATGKDFTSF